MVTKLDDSVGKIVQKLQQRQMLNDTIIIFSSDNGGPAEGFNLNHASNWPLRGVKNTLWEGGVRAAGLLFYPQLKKPKRVSDQIMHIVDWVPTLLSAAGMEYDLMNHTTSKLDGISVWHALNEDSISPRKNILHNIDDIWGSAGVLVGDWKVLKGTNYNGAWDGWYGPAGARESKLYDIRQLRRSLSGQALTSLNLMPSTAEILRLRKDATIDCAMKEFYLKEGTNCKPLLKPCLFNVRDDPCERYNLAQKYPNILNTILKELALFNATAIPPGNKPLDPNGNPSLWDYTWTNFGDLGSI